jgi:heme oxygenase (mycobilin-producing)
MPDDKDDNPVGEDDAGVTFINVIEIPADQVDQFVAGWRDRARIMSTPPGFRDYRLHRAVATAARFQLVAVAHWDSSAAFESAIANPEFLSQRWSALESGLDVTAYPGLYREVVRPGDKIR